MRIRIEVDERYDEPEIVIKTAQIDETILSVQKRLSQINQKITVYKQTTEYFIKFSDVLFFETDGTKVFAHDVYDIYETKYKLYELEEILPAYFCRVSKSGIVNTRKIYAVEKSFSGSGTIRFYKSVDTLHVSRRYDKILKEKLSEWR